MNLRWKCDSFAVNRQILCPLKNAKFIVVCHPGLKLYRTMNVRNLVHALTPHYEYTKLYVSCQSHFYSLKPGVDDACFSTSWLQHEMSYSKQQRQFPTSFRYLSCSSKRKFGYCFIFLARAEISVQTSYSLK